MGQRRELAHPTGPLRRLREHRHHPVPEVGQIGVALQLRLQRGRQQERDSTEAAPRALLLLAEPPGHGSIVAVCLTLQVPTARVLEQSIEGLTMNIALWIVSSGLALAFVFSGSTKLSQSRDALAKR